MQRMNLRLNQGARADAPDKPTQFKVLVHQIEKAEKQAAASKPRNPEPLKQRKIEIADAD